MINQVLSVTPTKTGQLLFPSTVTVPGTPMLQGSIPCINLDAYQAAMDRHPAGKGRGHLALVVSK